MVTSGVFGRQARALLYLNIPGSAASFSQSVSGIVVMGPSMGWRSVVLRVQDLSPATFLNWMILLIVGLDAWGDDVPVSQAIRKSAQMASACRRSGISSRTS